MLQVPSDEDSANDSDSVRTGSALGHPRMTPQSRTSAASCSSRYDASRFRT